MNRTVVESKLSIIFIEPFWVGVYERITNNKNYEVCKITFGAEPSIQEVYIFLLKNWSKLRFSQATDVNPQKLECRNPKRQQRIINKQLQNTGMGTKAQQILKQQYEQNKATKAKSKKLKAQAAKDYQHQLRKEKQKLRHRGK